MTARSARLLAAGRRVSWGLVDQVLSSLTNFTLTVVVARFAGAPQLGGFAITMATYLVLTGLGQGLVAQPFAVRYSAGGEPAADRAVRGAAGVSLLLGIGGGAGCVAAGAIAGGALGAPLEALGVALPGLLLQDAWRFIFVALGRPARAAWNDGAWALAQAAGFALLLLAGRTSAASFVAAWGIAGGVAAAIGCAQARALPSPTGAVAWLRAEWELGSRFAAQALVIRGALPLVYTAIALIAGLGAAGAVRGAQVVFSPLTLMYQGLLFAAVPEGVRTLRTSTRPFLAFPAVVSLGAMLPAIGWCLVALVLPSPAGRLLLGSTWDMARPLLPAIAVQSIAIAVSLGPQVGVRALGAARHGLRADTVQAVLLLVATSAGAAAGGGRGAAAGIALATTLGAILWWIAVATAPARPAAQARLAGAAADAGIRSR